MRYVLGLPTDQVDRPSEFLTADAVADVARAAEEAGFDAVSVTDHPFPQDKWLSRGGHQALDRWSLSPLRPHEPPASGS